MWLLIESDIVFVVQHFRDSYDGMLSAIVISLHKLFLVPTIGGNKTWVITDNHILFIKAIWLG